MVSLPPKDASQLTASRTLPLVLELSRAQDQERAVSPEADGLYEEENLMLSPRQRGINRFSSKDRMLHPCLGQWKHRGDG